jgi:hypothetical protein
MASYSRRLSEQRYFTNGLLALGLASPELDTRDVRLVLSLYWYVHKKNGLSFDDAFNQNDAFAPVLEDCI